MIAHPVQYSRAAALVVSSYDSLSPTAKDGSFWDRDDVAVVRKEAKQHYVGEQTYRCCYCDRSLHSQHGRVWDVEHVVSRSTHPQFLFEPQNLAVACVECNGEKSNARVLRTPNRKTYPRKSDAFLICHPHFDVLADHVLILLERLYFPRSDKGRRTIEICGLLRFAYAYIEWDSGIADNSALQNAFRKVMDAKNSTDQAIGIMEALILSGLRIAR